MLLHARALAESPHFSGARESRPVRPSAQVEALTWLRTASDEEHAEAMYTLAVLLRRLDTKDPPEARGRGDSGLRLASWRC